MRREGGVLCVGKKRNAYGILMGKPEEKNPLKRLDLGGRNNIATNLKGTGWDGLD